MQDRVLLTLGARHQKIEGFSYDYNTGAQTSSYSAARWTPVAGFVLRPSKAVSVYATYIEGLVKGDTAPLTVACPPPAQPGCTVALANGGEVFRPSQTKQGELGVKWDLGRFGGAF